ncbi:jg24993 [Pararge aegeria aegeria]|uniref:Jg24993 protein n=1 Tax=Pararge aegeria aegeria TaxID=348720 RepID=A0A8S4QKH0_9NEOP|nr:jg24993 [Pararge aegeria aegeria]
MIRAAKMWNALPATVFPATYNLSTFKARNEKGLGAGMATYAIPAPKNANIHQFVELCAPPIATLAS